MATLLTFIQNYPNEEQTRAKYVDILPVLVPLLLSLTRKVERCFSQVIRLCYRHGSVSICSGYPNIKDLCPQNYRFVFFFVDLIHQNSDGRIEWRHSNALLIDRLCQVAEFFEPNGSAASWYPLVASYLQNMLQDVFPDYHFLTTSDFCPFIGPQCNSGIKMCAAFSFIFLWMRLEDPYLTSEEIITEIITRPNLKDFMERLVSYLFDYAQENQLFQLQALYEKLSPQYDVENAYVNLDLPLLMHIDDVIFSH